MAQDKKKWLIGCSVVVVLFFAGIIISVALASKSSMYHQSGSTILNKDMLGIVTIEDVIFSSDEIVGQILELKDEPNVKSMVLRINSPGGAVAPSQEIFEAVKSFKNSGKPVIASFGSVAASGGYYIACAADTIMANPGTLTGSIGVIFEFPTAPEFFKKIGVDWEVVKSGAYKDAGGFHRKLTGEERALFQGVINDTWQQFMEAVAYGRHMKIEDVRKIADGRVMTGRQALAIGLVDTMGTFEDAKDLARKAGKLPMDAEEYLPAKKKNIFERLMAGPEEILKLKNSFRGGLSFLFTR